MNRTFVKVDLEAMKFSLTDIYIYFVLKSFMNNDTMKAFPKQVTIAEKAGVSEREVCNAIKKFKEAGIIDKIEVVRSYNIAENHAVRLNHYYFIDDIYRQISTDLIGDKKLTAKQKGMLIILMLNCYVDKPVCEYSRKELYERCKFDASLLDSEGNQMCKWGISHNTFDKYFKELQDLGYVKSNGKGYRLLREDLYIIPEDLPNTMEQFYKED